MTWWVGAETCSLVSGRLAWFCFVSLSFFFLQFWCIYIYIGDEDLARVFIWVYEHHFHWWFYFVLLNFIDVLTLTIHGHAWLFEYSYAGARWVSKGNSYVPKWLWKSSLPVLRLGMRHNSDGSTPCVILSSILLPGSITNAHVFVRNIYNKNKYKINLETLK